MEFDRNFLSENNEEKITVVAPTDEPSHIENSSNKFSLDVQTTELNLKLITWNVCGVQSENLTARTEAICKIIEAEQADIVCLQEVVSEAADYIKWRLSNYHCCFANKENDNKKDEEDMEDQKKIENGDDEEDEELLKGEYFVGTLLRKSSVSFIDHEIIDFPFSKMLRHLMKVNVLYKDLPICILNSHLETLKKNSEERKKQLEIVFKSMLDAPENHTVLFGGDTSLRDKELTDLGGLPPGIEDVWASCGSQKRSAYTFDLSENDNLKVNWKINSGSRLDRVFIRRSSPPKLKPASFELIGRERLSTYGCFPSDHWGILCHFEKDDFKFKLDKGFSLNSDEVQILQPYWMRKQKT